MAAISLILIIQKIFQLPTPSQSLGLRFSECRRKWNISVDHYEKLKNGYHFFKYHTEKFPITDPPQKNGCHFLCRHKWNISRYWDANFHFSEFSIGSFSPFTHPRLHFNIYASLHVTFIVCLVHFLHFKLMSKEPIA